MTFFDKFLKRQVEAKDIHKFIDDWHKATTTMPVYEYLGMTEDQYSIFIRHPEQAENLRQASASLVEKLRNKYCEEK